MNSVNMPMIRKQGFFSNMIIKIRSILGKKEHKKESIKKDDFFVIYAKVKSGEILPEELDIETLEALVKIANEEKKIKETRINTFKQELCRSKDKVLEMEELIQWEK